MVSRHAAGAGDAGACDGAADGLSGPLCGSGAHVAFPGHGAGGSGALCAGGGAGLLLDCAVAACARRTAVAAAGRGAFQGAAFLETPVRTRVWRTEIRPQCRQDTELQRPLFLRCGGREQRGPGGGADRQPCPRHNLLAGIQSPAGRAERPVRGRERKIPRSPFRAAGRQAVAPDDSEQVPHRAVGSAALAGIVGMGRPGGGRRHGACVQQPPAVDLDQGGGQRLHNGPRIHRRHGARDEVPEHSRTASLQRSAAGGAGRLDSGGDARHAAAA